MADPLLSRYSVVMLDEEHERSVHTDVLLGLLKRVQRQRPELRLIIASATVDAQAFEAFFETNRTADHARDTAAIVSLPGGGVHEVSMHFVDEPVSDYLEHAVHAAWQIHEPARRRRARLPDRPTGGRHRRLAARRPHHRAAHAAAAAAAAHLRGTAGRGAGARLRAGAAGVRKVIVATNVAETSITIDGVVWVDCGFVKQRFADAATGHEALVVTEETHANARQRAGRAGRVRPGSCYVLMTEGAYRELQPHAAPEITRCGLAAVALQLWALGVDNVLRFDFLSPPPPQALANALERLYAPAPSTTAARSRRAASGSASCPSSRTSARRCSARRRSGASTSC